MRVMALIVLSVINLTGCGSVQSMHYNWAYTQLHDASNGSFQNPPDEIMYRKLDSIKDMAEAERDMYRQGYVMIGYSNMMSPQLEMVATPGAKALGEKYGASAVLNTFENHHYLATLWARPKQFIFGAYFTDKLPDEARAALKEILKIDSSVIVQTVVEDSPAFRAKVRPGDLLISLNGVRIENVANINSLLKKYAGTKVTLLVWSMEEGPPHPVEVALNSLH